MALGCVASVKLDQVEPLYRPVYQRTTNVCIVSISTVPLYWIIL